MGNPHPRFSLPGLEDAANIRRLVVLSPFFIDATEVSVRQYRAFGTPSFVWSGKSDGLDTTDYCTFTTKPMSNEDLPVNCILSDEASAYCAARGYLPSEAQFEYVASGLRGALFVWGADDQPACADAVLDRGGFNEEATGGRCHLPTGISHPETIGSLVDPPRRDRLEFDGGAIFDLVGNVSEWTRDVWNNQHEPCWSALSSVALNTF